MPAKKKTTRKTGVQKSNEEPKAYMVEEIKDVEQNTPRSHPSRKIIYFIVGIIVILLVSYFGKGIFLAGLVNGHPITRWQLDRELEKKDASTTLDNLVNEILIESELSKQKVDINNTEVDKELNSIRQNLPTNTSLEEALKQQGMTMDDLKKQIIVKLKVERILDPKVSISNKETEDFITQNPSSLSSTDSAQQKDEAREILRQQKLGTTFNSWLLDLKTKASILKFSL